MIEIQTIITAPIQKVWKYWTEPEHILHWNNASDDWHTTHAENDLRTGGKFVSRMEAKDGSQGFDFNGVCTEVITNELIAYSIEGGRKVSVTFEPQGNQAKVTESFEPENINSLEMQQAGWQAILDNFKKYVEK